ncbi:hypothetical protein ACFWY6_32940 [Streptomyces sp. NPDC059037]|uniref:hypothetical protein n=1 Tax=Streptomyces sp. NPDC059037 TaxID=3346710 RepID=UPI0036B6420C
MSISQLRELNLPTLDESDAADVMGDGKKLSKAQCAYIKTLSFTSIGISCGGSPQDYIKMYNQFCK